MNELELSNDLTQITTEIKTYQSIGGQAIFEIGRRLKWVKENDLAHGEFGKWLESIDMNHNMANKFMKIVSEIPNYATSYNLGTQALYEIATMPEEEREKPQQLNSGETKTPDEMTVRELRELKQQLKHKDKQIAQQARMIDDLNEQEPQVVEKEVEVEKVPEDYHGMKQHYTAMKNDNETYKQQNKQLRSELKELEKKQQETNRSNTDDQQQEMELKRLQREANINVYQFIIATNDFIKDQSISAYDSGAIASASDETKEKLIGTIGSLEKFIKEVKQEIKGEVKWVINN